MKKYLKIIVPVIVIILIVFIWYKVATSPRGKNIDEVEVTIPLGTGTNGIASILKKNDIIRSENAFRIFVKINNISDFQAGTYYLKQSMTLKEITNMLKTGIMYDPNQITLTYLEGKNIRWLSRKIDSKTNNTEEDVLDLLKDETYLDSIIEKYWFVSENVKDKEIYYSLEGYLFPDTYSLSNKDVTVKEIFEKMLNQTEKILKDYKEDIENSKYSVHQLLTIASIIEMESMSNDSRKQVSSVIYNRLNKQMAIQSDVTTYYAFKIDMGERDLYQKEIDTYNQYNTRGPNMQGKLPIGPISSVGKNSIEAAIYPDTTDYLFFVADKNGKIYLTKTDAEHLNIINKLKSEGLWLEY